MNFHLRASHIREMGVLVYREIPWSHREVARKLAPGKDDRHRRHRVRNRDHRRLRLDGGLRQNEKTLDGGRDRPTPIGNS
jgi:hypothetical protein